MRKNIVSDWSASDYKERKLEYDWYSGTMPENACLHPSVYIDTSYIFDGFYSDLPEGLKIGKASGCYDRTSMQTTPCGKITIGEYSILNGTSIIANNYIEIGDHCMLAWGSVLVDCWNNFGSIPIEGRKKILELTSQSEYRFLSFYLDKVGKIILENNVWIGFDTIIVGDVRIGEGAVIGSKTIISENIPPYAVVVGNPPKIVRYLNANTIKSLEDDYFKPFINHDRKTK